MTFDIEDWDIHMSDIACHKSGLTISRTKVDDSSYNIRLWNTSEWEAGLRNSHYLSSEIGLIKLGLMYQYIQLMNRKEHTNNHYSIPEREAIREQIRRDKEYEQRTMKTSTHKPITKNINPIVLDKLISTKINTYE